MPQRKSIPQSKNQSALDAANAHGEIKLSYVPEVLDLCLPVLQKDLQPPRSVHPRPMLPSRIAVIGNYLPRRCGIATFTTDLCDAIHAEYGATELLALPVNDTPEGYSYPARMRFELSQDELASYRQAADFLNFSNIDLVCLQHEYGIFGGPAGAHILELLRRLHMPFVTTLHTVLRDPNPDQRAVMEEIAALSDRLIVMSRQSAEILQEVFHVPPSKIDLIPHGIPDLPFTDPHFYKDAFGTEGKDVLLTFGLLSPNKGIENVIQALPGDPVAPQQCCLHGFRCHPSAHPAARGRQVPAVTCRSWREISALRANVIFRNRFVSPARAGRTDRRRGHLHHALQAQGASGFRHARLCLERRQSHHLHSLSARDRIVGRRTRRACSLRRSAGDRRKNDRTLDNGTARHAMRKRAYLYARDMVWNRVAQQYMGSFERVYNERLRNPRATFSAQNTEKTLDRLPAVKLDHLYRMTDHTGIVEHAVFVVPNYPEGYSTDDNARALIVAILLEELGIDAPAGSPDLASRYLAFLWLAFDPTTKRFRNCLSYERQWQEPEGSEDSHGRALWGLGTVLGRTKDAGLRGAAGRLFELAVPAAVEFRSPRACAFALLGLHEYLESFPGDRAAAECGRMRWRIACSNSYRANRSDDWKWFENVLSRTPMLDCRRR